MASVFLIVGVGGGGRGVLNHVKYELEQEYGTTDKARVRLVCIDGPEQDHYVLPGDFQIDTRPDSREFIQTRISPSRVIRNIAQGRLGREEKYIATWLPQREADKIPASALNPLTGLGGERVPGHALFYLQLDDLRGRLHAAYQQARAALGQADRHDRVVAVVIGSLSGGTGAGLLWDVAHILREPVAANHDPLVCLLPLPTTYHQLATSEGERIDIDAKNFAGLRELMRFMATRPTLPLRLTFSDTVAVENLRPFEVPFVLDGDRANSKVNDVMPQRGIVPAMADFLLTIIKDNLAANRPMYNNLVNWGTAHIGSAQTDGERFGTFGVSSLRYPVQEVLASFAYRFAYEIYETILEPTGSAVEAGRLLATKTLNDVPFTTMVENPAIARTSPRDYRQLASKISVGRAGSLPFPSRDSLTEEIRHGRRLMFFKVSDDEVIRNAETFRDLWLGRDTDLASSTVRGWVNLQTKKITDLLFGTEKFDSDKDLGLVEQEIFKQFLKREGALLQPIAVYDAPHTIVIARDYLKTLKDKLASFAHFWEAEYRRHLYPEGEDKPSLIARQHEVVDQRKAIMRRSDKDLREEQEAYLVEFQKLVELEIWSIVMKGTGDLLQVLQEKSNRLWALIGDDADGWVNVLAGYKDLMERRASEDETRRTQFTYLKLRQYLPTPGGQAEDQLFEEVAVPVLNELLKQMHWSFAIDPKEPQRYTLLLVSPEVPGYDYRLYEGVLLHVYTQERLRMVHQYNPYQHVQYANNTLRGLLEQKTIWDMLWYDFAYEWKRQPEHAEDSIDDYVKDTLDWLLLRAEPLLNYNVAPNLHREAYLFSKFVTTLQPTNPAHLLATRFAQAVRQAGRARNDC